MSRNILSIAALLIASSTALAQTVHAPVTPAPTPAPTHVPAPAAEAAPVATVPAAPAPAEVPAAPIVTAPVVAPVVAEPAPAQKPAVSAAGTKISLYGFAQLNAVWEDGVTNTSANNWSYFAPSDNKNGGSRTLLNVNHSRFGINFSDSPTEGGTELSGKIETDFNNSNSRTTNGAGGFRIRHSYGQVKFSNIDLALLFGQTSNVISPRDPSILNEGTGNYTGNIGSSRVPQIRITKGLGPAEIAVAAIDDRGAGAPVFPAVQGRVGLKVPAGWAGEKQNLEVGVSGHFASEKNTDTDTKNKSSVKVPKSWSANADLNLPIIDIIGLSGEFFYGQNLKNYANGSLGLDTSNIDVTSAKYKEGDGVKSFGFWTNLSVKLPASLSLGGGFGMESIANDDILKAKTRSGNTGIFGNLRYNFIPSAFVGIEYWHISTDYTDGVDASGKAVSTPSGAINRIELAFNYAFK